MQSNFSLSNPILRPKATPLPAALATRTRVSEDPCQIWPVNDASQSRRPTHVQDGGSTRVRSREGRKPIRFSTKFVAISQASAPNQGGTGWHCGILWSPVMMMSFVAGHTNETKFIHRNDGVVGPDGMCGGRTISLSLRVVFFLLHYWLGGFVVLLFEGGWFVLILRTWVWESISMVIEICWWPLSNDQ